MNKNKKVKIYQFPKNITEPEMKVEAINDSETDQNDIQ